MSKEIEDEVWMDDESYYLLKCSKLEKKLDIATKALNRVYHDMKCWTFISKRDRRVLSVICEALKEIDLVGTSAKEEV